MTICFGGKGVHESQKVPLPGPKSYFGQTDPEPPKAKGRKTQDSASKVESFATDLSADCRESGALWDLVYRYSSLNKLLRITSYCLRFLTHLVDRVKLKSSWAKSVEFCELPFLSAVTNPENIQLPVSEIKQSKLLWIYLHQKHHFSQVIFKISSKRPLKGNKQLVRLKPILKDGLLKVGGR